jgi:hypothetical protein
MTGQGPRKPVGAEHWNGRLNQAREFRESARNLVTLDNSRTYNPAITLMVLCAIAYADAITAKKKGVVNAQDHASAPRLLREVLGNHLPDRQEKFYRRLPWPQRRSELRCAQRHAQRGRATAVGTGRLRRMG